MDKFIGMYGNKNVLILRFSKDQMISTIVMRCMSKSNEEKALILKLICNQSLGRNIMM